MKINLHLALLGSAALVLIAPLFALAAPGDPIPGIEVGLEGDPEGRIVATAKTDAGGKFEFKGLKAGNYHLVLPSKAKTTDTVFAKRVLRITNVRANARVPGLDEKSKTAPNPEAPGLPTESLSLNFEDVLVPVNPDTGRSEQAIVIPMDDGTIRGELRIADNESPLPQDRGPIYVGDDRPHNLINQVPADAEKITTVVGKFVSFNNGSLILLVAAMEGEEPQLTEFGRVTAVVVDPTDPMAKSLPAEEAFKNLPVGTSVKVETNEQGSIIAILVGLLLPKTADANSQGSTKATADPNAWRYKQQNGEWWYFTDKNQWLVYRIGKWTPYQATGGTVGQQGAASIFDRWGKQVPANSNQGVNGSAATPRSDIPGIGSPVGSILPGLRQPTGTKSGSPVGGVLRGKR